MEGQGKVDKQKELKAKRRKRVRSHLCLIANIKNREAKKKAKQDEFEKRHLAQDIKEAIPPPQDGAI